MTFSKLKYPTYNSEKEIAISAIIVALLVYLFLALFQPFGTYNYVHTNKYLLLVPYAIIVFVSFFIGDFFISKYFTKWTWKNEVSKTLVLLLFCAILNYGYSIYFVNNTAFNLRTLFYMVIFTYSLGLPICAISSLGKYSFLKNNNFETEREETKIETKVKTENILSIIPDVGENLEILKNTFIYAQSEGNYSNIFYLNNEIVEKELLRISLKNLEEQIGDDTIIRCHRSYILNIQNAIRKQGNAQGFKILLKLTDEKIPVSRKYIDKINSIPL
jgi:hypothetical protein